MAVSEYRPGFLLKLIRHVEFPKKYGLLDRLLGKNLSRYGITSAETSVGLLWKLDLRLSVHRWIIYGMYDGPFLKWTKKHLGSNSVVVDSGANIGQMSLYFAKCVPQGKVLAFEPDLEAGNWLNESIYLNKGLPIQLIRSGLGENESQKTLSVPADGKDLELHGFWSFISENEDPDGQKISMVRLQDTLESLHISEVDLWKLDVEGFEIPALKGAEHFLKTKKIKALYIELAIKENNHKKIMSYMNALGYDCHYFDRSGRLHKSNETRDYQTDGLFLPA
jgi:FkbM family methyltransferase